MDNETFSNDYSKIDKDTRDVLAEQLAFAANDIGFLSAKPGMPHWVFDELMYIRKELLKVINDLGGPPEYMGGKF